MESSWAKANLETIRTLMERAAVYRRALGPITLQTGALGVVAAVIGWKAQLIRPATFVAYWLVVGLLAVGGAFLLARRQALKDAEPFWSPPTRRVAWAMLPALSAGLLVGLAVLLIPGLLEAMAWFLPGLWMMLYGCAVHAAAFFTPRGLRLLGWLFIVVGGVTFLLGGRASPPDPAFVAAWAHAAMGIGFGAIHLAYGFYLQATERQHAA